VQLVFLPMFVEGAASPLQDVLDVVTVIALVLVLGFHWRLALAFAAELIPEAVLFPTWLAVVGRQPAHGDRAGGRWRHASGGGGALTTGLPRGAHGWGAAGSSGPR
jgi:hypothetical protein